jgi:hypothetical protein
LLNHDLDAELLVQRLGDFLQPVQPARYQNQRKALCGILACELLAEATRCARDENPRFVWRIHFVHLQGGQRGRLMRLCI